jgi:hypothetical protein
MNKYSYGLYFSLLACLLLSLFYAPPFDLGMSDKEIFSYIGWALSKGVVPYRDVFDHKPPLIFFIYYLGLLGGPWGLWLLNTLLALVTTGLFFRYCSRYRLYFSWLLPLLLNLMMRDYLISDGINMTREYTSWFFILFFCALLSKWRFRFIAMGFFGGLVFFTQQDQILPLLPFIVYVLVTADRLPAGKRFLQMTAGLALVLLPILVFFAIHRSLGYFWDEAFLFNFKVYTAEPKSLGDHFRTIKRVLDAGNYEIPFMVAACLGLVALIRPSKKKRLIAAAFAAFWLTLCSEFMGGRYKGQALAVDYYYYFIPVAAGVVLLLFTVFAFGEESSISSPALRLPYTLLLCCSIGYTALQHSAHLQRRSRDPVIDSPELNYLRQHHPADYGLYVFQNDDYIAAYSELHTLAPSRWLYQHFWNWYPDWDSDGAILRSIADDLVRHHTAFLIMDPANPIRNARNREWWIAFVQTHYQPVPMPGKTQTLLWQLKANP